MLYCPLTAKGDKLGITTYAPAKIPASRPCASNVAKAVVAGINASGKRSLINAIRRSVKGTDPAG